MSQLTLDCKTLDGRNCELCNGNEQSSVRGEPSEAQKYIHGAKEAVSRTPLWLDL